MILERVQILAARVDTKTLFPLTSTGASWPNTIELSGGAYSILFRPNRTACGTHSAIASIDAGPKCKHSC